MKAKLIVKERVVYPDGDLAEMVVWQLSTSVPPTLHGFKYRFVYIAEGKRILGYDNERGKGDHRHFRDEEQSIDFLSIEVLLEAFVSEVETLRRSK
jgi:hypothetical protein